MKKIILALAIFLPVVSFAQTVDLLWQGENYVHPFYKGLPLWSNQSEITFVAFIDEMDNIENLSYTWLRNDNVIGSSSGIGKNSISFLDTIFSKPISIEVEVYNENEEFLASDSVTLVAQPPITLVYENSPLYGILFNREGVLGYNFENVGEEKVFTAFPFFFSAISKDSENLSYIWGKTVSQNSSATYKAPDEISALSNIDVGIRNKEMFKQNSMNSFRVQFKKQ